MFFCGYYDYTLLTTLDLVFKAGSVSVIIPFVALEGRDAVSIAYELFKKYRYKKGLEKGFEASRREFIAWYKQAKSEGKIPEDVSITQLLKNHDKFRQEMIEAVDRGEYSDEE